MPPLRLKDGARATVRRRLLRLHSSKSQQTHFKASDAIHETMRDQPAAVLRITLMCVQSSTSQARDRTAVLTWPIVETGLTATRK